MNYHKNIQLCFLFFVCLFFSPVCYGQTTFNIISSNNGKGLEKSRSILKNKLLAMGHIVHEKEFDQDNLDISHVDVNIFCERINALALPFASLNWFIPNPECYEQELSLLNSIDLILCRTHEVERIFEGLNKKTYYLGFTSQDCKLLTKEKNYSSYLHLAGGSSFKGSNAILQAWNFHPLMPYLTMVIHYNFPLVLQENLKWVTRKIPTHELQQLQNSCGVHLCLSETEGFGHYLMEAMSTSAVVITTDAPPMNEFITDKRCLVPYLNTKPCRLAIRYFADPDQLRIVVQNLMNLSPEELKQIGEKNRSNYLQKTKEFGENLKRLLNDFNI